MSKPIPLHIRADIYLACNDDEVNIVKNRFGACLDAADSEDVLIDSFRKLVAKAAETGARVAVLIEGKDEDLAVVKVVTPEVD